MATNEEIIQKMSKLEEAFIREINEVRDMARKNDEAIRGNGEPGLKSQVSSHEDTIKEIKWYFRGILMVFIGQLIAQVVGLL